MHMKILAQLIMLLGIPGIIFKQGKKTNQTLNQHPPSPKIIAKVPAKLKSS